MKHVFIAAALVFSAGCKKDQGSGSDAEQSPNQETTEDDKTVLESSPSTLAVGGMPDETEITDITSMELGEAQSSANDINRTSTSMTLNLSVDSDGSGSGENGTGSQLKLTEQGGDCKDGVFCLATVFGSLYDGATQAAACNFKLLLQNPDGSERPLKSVSLNDRQVYYIDGFGTVGFNEGGTTCPDHKTVFDWARSHHLVPDDGSPKPESVSNDFFPPTRLVLFKKTDGNVYWKFIFFPKDFIAALAKRIPPFSKIMDGALDFKMYSGFHKIGEEVGKSKGMMTLSWDELHRMMGELDKLDDGQSLTQGEDNGPPHGEMEIVYDQVSDPVQFSIEFKGEFKEDSGPFQKGVPAIVMRSGDEHYLRFETSQVFGQPDDNNPEDKGLPVHFCINENYPGQDQPPFEMLHVKDVPAESFLSSGKTYLQIIWKDIPAGKTRPDDYLTRISISKGGAFIYGDVQMEGFQKGGTLLNGTRIKAPLCAAATPQAIESRNQDMRTYLNNPDYSWLDVDGFQNMIFQGEPGSGTPPTFASKETVLGMAPVITKFKFIDPVKADENPFIGK